MSDSLRQTQQAQRVARLGNPASRAGSLPEGLSNGIAALSGVDVSDVQVHTGSSRPAQLNAHAFAQGQHIHLAPGQEKHLPHEAWHIVQQRQGRVRPTGQVGGQALNDDPRLEREADTMGAKALSAPASSASGHVAQPRAVDAGPAQLTKEGALLGGLAGAGALGATGAILGSVVPGIGTALGAAAGSALGGLLGGLAGHLYTGPSAAVAPLLPAGPSSVSGALGSDGYRQTWQHGGIDYLFSSGHGYRQQHRPGGPDITVLDTMNNIETAILADLVTFAPAAALQDSGERPVTVGGQAVHYRYRKFAAAKVGIGTYFLP
jgi:hypothetical protein